MPKKETRKLAAVMFTDIAGYTAMVQADESRALGMVGKYRQVLEQQTEKYGGSVISYYGDGSLTIYPSAIEAVRCAIGMQQAYRTDPMVPVRVGVHLGDIVFKDDTVYGDGVNVASRIESQGIPGCILISDKIQQEIGNHPDVHSVKLGAFDLKNVKNKTVIYAVSNPGIVVPKAKSPIDTSRNNLLRIAGIIVTLFLLSYFAFNSGLLNFLKSEQVEAREERVAVFFDSAFLPDSLRKIPEMAGRLVVDALVDVKDAKVTSYESVLRQVERQQQGKSVIRASLSPDSYAAFSANTGALNLLNGYIIFDNDSLEFRANLEDLEDGDIIQRFPPKKFPADQAYQAIEELLSEILGWWASKDAKTLTIPTKEAYEAYLDAKDNWRSNDSLAELSLKKAIRLDQEFLDPYFLLMELYYNNRRFAEIEAYIDTVGQRFREMTPRQQRLLDYHKADVQGKLADAYKLFMSELATDPLDLFSNTSALVMAHDYVNAPEDIIEYFEMIPIDSLDLSNCQYCGTRVRLATRAYQQLGRSSRVNKLMDYLRKDDVGHLKTVVLVHASRQDTQKINELVNIAKNTKGIKAGDIEYEAAYQFRLLDDIALSDFYAQQVIDRYPELHGTRIRAQLISGKTEDALAALMKWQQQFPENQFILSHLALAHAALGNREQAENLLRDLLAQKPEYDYGVTSYTSARVRVQLGDLQDGIALLRNAYESGTKFYDHYFHHDIFLKPIHDDPDFVDLLHPLE